MTRCSSCGSEMPANARFCAACGQPAGSSPDALTAPGSSAPPSSHISRPSSSVQGRFAPGVVLAERYRIVAPLGKGGMGEVYRADDLRLGNPVALKFLPSALAADPRLLERFHAEVRNARQISHPNICRVYDIGEVAGQHFLTMEYIDGEDLASLLRRIGRLPADKAVEIAHQLCGGLAAAHEVGVLHRDLKPANVMLDGRGRARITDFGLAVTAEETAMRAEFAGTPAYMAPEQLAGGSASVQSDIYSLGLVLFETFTGKRASEGDLLARWRTTSSAPTQPGKPGASTSSVTSDIDPAVQRAILRCLDPDPSRRPASAIQVARALPGGDPLAAALAAGETPSPEMVAAAGEEVGISAAGAFWLVLAAIVCIAIGIPLGRRASLIGLAPIDKSPDSLSDRARDMAQKFGYPSPADSSWWFTTSDDYVRYRAKNEPSKQWRRDLPTSWRAPFRFHYRQSPRPMSLPNPLASMTPDHPPLVVPGMIYLAVDTGGHLVALRGVPPAIDEGEAPTAKFDWGPVFAEANLNPKDFQPVPPKFSPSAAYDERAAWDGTVRGGIALHLEAASYRGKLVYFEMTAPWTPRRGAQGGSNSVTGMILSVMLLIVMPIGGLAMARRNLRLGRGDLKGATRLAVYVIVASALQRFLWAHIASTDDALGLFVIGVGFSLFFGALTWVVYLALEPLVRRQNPELLISWTRLLSGRFTDPLVGRDILLGVAGAALLFLVNRIDYALPWWFDMPTSLPPGLSAAMTRPYGYASQLLNGLWGPVLIAVALLLLAAVTRMFFRTRWPGLLVAGILINDIDSSLRGTTLVIEVLASVVAAALAIWLLGKIGPLGFTAWLITVSVLQNVSPMTLQFGTWYVGYDLFSLALLAAVTVFAFRNALAGRPVFMRLMEDA